MNPKTIIQAIERNHEIMAAQVEKLGEYSPRLQQLSLGRCGGTSESVADLLNTAVLGHLQGAADALHAIAEVEARVRDKSRIMENEAHRQPEIFDAEVVVVKAKE